MYTLQDYVFLFAVVVIAISQAINIIRLIALDKKLRKAMRLYGKLCNTVIDDVASVCESDDDNSELIRSWKKYIQELTDIF